MSDMSRKEIQEQLSIIREDAGLIEISDKVKPQNMMMSIELMEKKEISEKEIKETEIKKTDIKEKGIKDKISEFFSVRKRLKTVAVLGVAAALFAVVMLVTGNNNRVYPSNEYYKMVSMDGETASDTDIPVLSGYGNLHKYLVVENTREFKYDFFEEVGNFFSGFGMAAADGAASENWTSSSGDSGYSETNTRTGGIDEADVVKTDGRYIYYLYRDVETIDIPKVYLTIVEANGEETTTVSETDVLDLLPEIKKSETVFDYVMTAAMDLLIWEDRLVLICSYDTTTYVVFWDISDRQKPEHMDTLFIDGQYDSCKLVDGYAYIVTNKSALNEVEEYTEQLSEEEAKELLAVKSSNGMADSEDVYVSESPGRSNYTVVASVDMKETDRFKDIKAILGSDVFGSVYMSENNIYYISKMNVCLEDMVNMENAADDEHITVRNSSEIISLSYENGVITPKSRAVVDGCVGDEFDVDEYNGYLRMAVTVTEETVSYEKKEAEYYDGTQWLDENIWCYDEYISSTTYGSALYVLDDNLTVVGSIPHLKENESVYGVRFDGDMGYVVTYRQTDPLFTIDLSDPANPVVVGELKIPGYSEYLHKWDDNTLVGLGYGAEDFIKISTFDITDKTNVVEKDVCNVSAYDAEALYNHRALLISPEKNLMGFVTDWGAAYYVYAYVDGKLEKVIYHPLKYRTDYGDGNVYIRGLYIGDYFYIVSDREGIYVYDLNTYEKVK